MWKRERFVYYFRFPINFIVRNLTLAGFLMMLIVKLQTLTTSKRTRDASVRTRSCVSPGIVGLQFPLSLYHWLYLMLLVGTAVQLQERHSLLTPAVSISVQSIVSNSKELGICYMYPLRQFPIRLSEKRGSLNGNQQMYIQYKANASFDQ